MSGNSKAKKKLPELDGHWTFHDLRRTFVTGLSELGVEPHVVEACVNHIGPAKSGVAGVYNRASYAEPKRIAMERWAQEVEQIVSGRKGGRGRARPLTHWRRREFTSNPNVYLMR